MTAVSPTVLRLLLPLLLLAGPEAGFAAAEEPPPTPGAEEKTPTEAKPVQQLTWQQTAAELDRLFEQAWQQEQVQPAEPAGDEEFLRRVYLDLGGRIPAVSEVRAFRQADANTRRGDVVDRLLQDPAWVRHTTTVLRNSLLPPLQTDPRIQQLVPGFEAWLWQRLADNTPWDEMVREIITSGYNAPGLPADTDVTLQPSAFLLARGLRPENLATGTAREFLGIRLDCAQCHDHPFDRWKQSEFWSFAAFYGNITPPDELRPAPAEPEKTGPGQIKIPSTDEVVFARFLTGDAPSQQSDQARQALADWITAANNPWFARMAANRVWFQFFGMGLVHPLDDFSELNPASHPQVLQLLADQLVAHDFDLKFLTRVIVGSQVYQRTSRQTHPSQADPTQFACAPVRGLTPEQMFDSLAEATGFYQPYRSDNPFVISDNTARGRFLQLFRDDATSPLDQRSTILQALAMMNSDFIGNATSLTDSRTLRAVLEFPLMSEQERLTTLFLASLSRPPTAAEEERLMDYLQQSNTEEDRAAALADVFWALLNSSEFLLNH